MKKTLYIVSMLAFLALSGQAMAYTISLSPASQTIGLGGTATVNVKLTVEALEQLDGFDLTLAFNNAFLGFDSTSSTTIGDTNLDYASGLTDNGTSIDLSGFFLGGTPLTSDTFTLASLNFFGNAYGTSPLDLTGTVLDLNDVSPFTLIPASGSVEVVPEPGTFLLLGLGLAGLVCFRKKFCTA